ncbi:hypothetical protein H7H98_10370 [Mycolicibacterium sphagni]|nr:hypothetical protein [Mycolicibacterium sphagni]
MTVDEKSLRVALRARARQLGDSLDKSSDPADVEVACPLLVSEVAYEQWHRFLFARFLEANGLLHHPDFGVAVTISDCDELAASLDEPDGWSVAARFAAADLPGVFKPADASVRIQLAREDLILLEKVVVGIPNEILAAEDCLGWVYQYWQSRAKKAVNDSGRKIGGSDLSPVTQLFTENYMVRFLLENSLGAWWASKHPNSPLLATFDFLQYDDEGTPASGAFEGWPETVAELTVMDPCCGSGHFLVAAFGMLWQMRAEAEGLSPADAQDAVLRDNLFGLELDPRCTQIAMFTLALEAWKQGGYRVIPVPQVACSGIPARAPLGEWTRLAGGAPILEASLARLHALFVDADTLGSLIDPVRTTEDFGLESVDWHDVAPLVGQALAGESSGHGDSAGAVFGEAAVGIARAADYLTRRYALVVTNPPYLGRGAQSPTLRDYCLARFPNSEPDLATVVSERCLSMGDSVALVQPQAWLFMPAFEALRREWLSKLRWHALARLGSGAFSSISGQVVQVVLWISSTNGPLGNYFEMDAASAPSPEKKLVALRGGHVKLAAQRGHQSVVDAVIMPAGHEVNGLIKDHADVRAGISTGDSHVFVRNFWEINPSDFSVRWERLRSAPGIGSDAGCELAVLWEGESGKLARWADSLSHLNHAAQKWRRGKPFWGRRGVAVKMMGELNVAPYYGERYDASVAVIVPKRLADLPALWAFARSGSLASAIRAFNSKLSIESGTVLNAAFDIGTWRGVAHEQFPDGFPEPRSDDATQWLFSGDPRYARQGLQVTVARLLGFRWPGQQSSAADSFVDGDGIVCLPAIAGEQSAAERVRAILAAAYGVDWSPATLDRQLMEAGGRSGDLTGWLANTYFKDHCKVFGHRPFVWHIWDGQRDGFSALVNYHRLDRANLEKLTYRTLGWWIDRQRADAESGVLGADTRLGAAQALQAKLQLILAGEPPYDIYVRWKSLAEQPIGWDPDLDDGVRVNIRPFVEAGVLRSKFTIHWKKDRGTNPDGSDRHNDLHYSVAEKRKARGLA